MSGVSGDEGDVFAIRLRGHAPNLDFGPPDVDQQPQSLDLGLARRLKVVPALWDMHQRIDHFQFDDDLKGP
jgi:hypothetical protein